MTATVVPGAPAVGEQPFSLRAILGPLVAIIVGIFMFVLDGTVVNVALPRLVADFHTTVSTLQWVITGYALAQAAVIPLAGWLSDRFGAKRVFLISVGLFTLGSVLCATSQSSGMLIAFRLLQGMGGGCLLPIGMAYTYRLSPPEKVGVVMGLMGVPILLAPAIGPVLSGWLVQYASWRWIFLLNLPVGIIGILVGVRSLPAVQRQMVALFDLPGTILGPLAFAALSYAVSAGSTSWTSRNAIGGLLVGGVALVAFIVVELRSENPLLELRVFRSVDFDLAIVVQWVGQFALFGGLFLVPIFLQQVRGYGAFDTGLTVLPQAIASAVCMPLGGMLFDRIGARPLVVVGLAIVAGGNYLLAHVSVSTTGPDLIVPLAMSGMGMGLMFMALNTHLINSAPRQLVSRVTSLTNALSQVVNSLSIATLSTILASRTTARIGEMMTAGVSHAAHAGAGTSAPAGSAGVARHATAAMMAGASAKAYDDTFVMMVGGAAVAMIIGLLLRRNRAAQQAQPVTVGQHDGSEVAPSASLVLG